MNILFMTLGKMENVEDHTIYCDLLRCFRDAGHSIYTISPYEKRTGLQTTVEEKNGVHMLHVRTGNVTGMASLFEKGVAQLTLESIFIKSIKQYYSNIKFDLIMYSTPPITFCNAIEYVKKRDGAKSYLLLKDIFPQNAVDIGLMSKSGFKGILYRFFRNKEKKLYRISDYIGCMSPANIEYLLNNNPEIPASKVEECPNSIELMDINNDSDFRREVRNKYKIPINKKVFIYGGNLGKPQGIDFLVQCMYNQRENANAYFLIVGDGTEYGKIERFFDEHPQSNLKLMKRLPKEDFENVVAACDVGMIFLDYRFTIPNFPSRLLSYMQAKIPVLVCTDPNTDIGDIAVNGEFGWKCSSNNVHEFNSCIDKAINADIKKMGLASRKYLESNYDVKQGYRIIMKHF